MSGYQLLETLDKIPFHYICTGLYKVPIDVIKASNDIIEQYVVGDFISLSTKL